MTIIGNVIGVNPPWLEVPGTVVPVIAAGVDIGRGLGLPIPADGNQIRMSARRLYYNCQKAWAELGEPQIDIRQSIQDTYDWYLDHNMI